MGTVIRFKRQSRCVCEVNCTKYSRGSNSHEPVDQFRNKIKDALRSDSVIGPDSKRKKLEEALAARLDNKPDEAGDGFWQKFKYFHFHYKLDGYSTSEALSRAFKKASGYNGTY